MLLNVMMCYCFKSILFSNDVLSQDPSQTTSGAPARRAATLQRGLNTSNFFKDNENLTDEERTATLKKVLRVGF